MAKGSKEMIALSTIEESVHCICCELLKDYSHQLYSITAFIHTFLTLSESWRERGVAVAVGTIAQWQSTGIKPEALGSTPGSTTFLLSPLLFQRSTVKGPQIVTTQICVSD